VSICSSIVATQDHAFISSSHINNNNLQGIQQFPLSALLSISLSHSLDYHQQRIQQPSTLHANFRSRQQQADSTQKISVSHLSISSSFPISELISFDLLCRHFSLQTLTTQFTTKISAMGRVCSTSHCLTDHELTISRADTTRSAAPRPTRPHLIHIRVPSVFDKHLSTSTSIIAFTILIPISILNQATMFAFTSNDDGRGYDIDRTSPVRIWR
jgi:hypothetical protein